MNKHWLISVAALTLVTAAGSFAADSTPAPAPATTTAGAPGTPPAHHEWTLDEARQHAHERADALDKMTPDQYAAEQKAHETWWHGLTPDQRDAIKKSHQIEHQGKAATTAAGASAPAAPAN